MSIAAAAVIGEKQARTLEPLLATPLTTWELLTAKVLGALLPAIGLSIGCFVVYTGGVWLFAEPGVFRLMLTARPLAVMFLIGPLASLAALQLAVCAGVKLHHGVPEWLRIGLLVGHAAQHRRRGLPRAAQQNQLNVEAMLVVNLRFLGDPRNPIACRQRRHAPIDLLERFVLSVGPWNAAENKKQNRGENCFRHGNLRLLLLPNAYCLLAIFARKAF